MIWFLVMWKRLQLAWKCRRIYRYGWPWRGLAAAWRFWPKDATGSVEWQAMQVKKKLGFTKGVI